jgi:hypothetical protein
VPAARTDPPHLILETSEPARALLFLVRSTAKCELPDGRRAIVEGRRYANTSRRESEVCVVRVRRNRAREPGLTDDLLPQVHRMTAIELAGEALVLAICGRRRHKQARACSEGRREHGVRRSRKLERMRARGCRLPIHDTLCASGVALHPAGNRWESNRNVQPLQHRSKARR